MNGCIGMSHYYCVHTRLCDDDGGMEGTFLDFIRINPPPPPFYSSFVSFASSNPKEHGMHEYHMQSRHFCAELKKKKHSVNEVN